MAGRTPLGSDARYLERLRDRDLGVFLVGERVVEPADPAIGLSIKAMKLDEKRGFAGALPGVEA
jgi:hypothetical protein